MAKKKVKSTKRTFEQSLSELESIVSELEGGELSLADALARYDAGVKHLKSCYHLLEEAERRIELISGVDADGKPVVQPFDDEQTELDEKASARSRKRSAKKRPPQRSREEEVDDHGTLF